VITKVKNKKLFRDKSLNPRPYGYGGVKPRFSCLKWNIISTEGDCLLKPFKWVIQAQGTYAIVQLGLRQGFTKSVLPPVLRSVGKGYLEGWAL
jgi:hypothetical protein